MAALFGSSSARSQSKNVVEFRAGKMTLDPKSKMVHPDKRKGLVYVHQSDDGLMHFCWKDRSKPSAEDDLIIFPDDAEFKHVPQCTTGRVYLLKFKASNKKNFFWMQEPKSDKDEESCKLINESLNNPPTPGSSRGGGHSGGHGLPADLASLAREGDLQNILGNMSQSQLIQLLGGVGMGGGGSGGSSGLQALYSGGGRPGSSTSSTSDAGPTRVQSSPGPRATTGGASDTPPQPPRPVTAATVPGGGARGSDNAAAAAPIQLSDLQDILSSMAVPGASPTPAVNLASALSPDVIIPLLAKPEIQEKLVPHLPEGATIPKTEAELRSTVNSPQFKQAVSTFGAALQSGELGPLMAQFGLPEAVTTAANKGDVAEFAKALQAAHESSAGAAAKEDPDTDMADAEKKD